MLVFLLLYIGEKTSSKTMKEQISETVTIFIVLVLLATVVFSVFDNQVELTKTIRENEIKTQQKFQITD